MKLSKSVKAENRIFNPGSHLLSIPDEDRNIQEWKICALNWSIFPVKEMLLYRKTQSIYILSFRHAAQFSKCRGLFSNLNVFFFQFKF